MGPWSGSCFGPTQPCLDGAIAGSGANDALASQSLSFARFSRMVSSNHFFV